jgi:iron-sulfur cluster assembly accessory protein
MIYITEKAAQKIKEIADDEEVGYYIVRVKQIGGGCNGFMTDLFFDDQIAESDEVFELDGVKVIVDQFSFQYMDETTIDFVEGSFEAGFKFLNPQVKSSCGCGKSVGY